MGLNDRACMSLMMILLKKFRIWLEKKRISYEDAGYDLHDDNKIIVFA